MEFEELQLVNYCYPGCIPMLNIMRQQWGLNV